MKALRFLTASNIIPMAGDLPDQPVLVFEDNRLVNILNHETIDPVKVEKYEGTLIPGFVNAHCHLELSHMKGAINSGTGLTSFLNDVVTMDPVDMAIILDTIELADKEMQDAGIVAVGDISNLSVTAVTKASSPIEYYTFVEMFDFLNPLETEKFYAQYESVFQNFIDQGFRNVTRVPHSPYTVSRKLGDKLVRAMTSGMTGSIHMLENEQENFLLKGEPSEYSSLFNRLGFALDHFQPPGHGSIEEFMLSDYHPERMLFVHNTVATEKDLELINKYKGSHEAYLVTCPNANLFIESRLPDYDLWLRSGLPICIGTDSYASNYQLSIWEEVRTIESRNDSLSWEELLSWATLNGARALGMDDLLGSFEPGKSPGAVLLEHRNEEDISADVSLRRIL